MTDRTKIRELLMAMGVVHDEGPTFIRVKDITYFFNNEGEIFKIKTE